MRYNLRMVGVAMAVLQDAEEKLGKLGLFDAANRCRDGLRDVLDNIRKSLDYDTNSRDGDLTPEEEETLFKGIGNSLAGNLPLGPWRNKIATIKLVRQRLNCDLRTAKEYVENWQNQNLTKCPSDSYYDGFYYVRR
jgi:hypothetical protein